MKNGSTWSRGHLRCLRPGEETFFLWGPRQTGKTTLLRQRHLQARWIDLLKADELRRYATHPELLRQELAAGPLPAQGVVDEVQRIPALLDEVHWLHEIVGARFALCGSSARKVRRGVANLLGGRALRYELRGLTAVEVGSAFELERALNHGWWPRIYESSRPRGLLAAYVGDYLKEEIAAEGLVRNLPAFSEFLDVAALSDGELINFANIARDCAASVHTGRSYFEILEDTLLGRWLPAYTRRPNPTGGDRGTAAGGLHRGAGRWPDRLRSCIQQFGLRESLGGSCAIPAWARETTGESDEPGRRGPSSACQAGPEKRPTSPTSQDDAAR